MGDHTLVKRLLEHRDSDGALLTVYLTLPPKPTTRRGLSTRVDAMLVAAEGRAAAEQADDKRSTKRRRTAGNQVRELAAERSRDWFGHSVAVVASAADGVVEELVLPDAAPDSAVFDRRVNLRPLLAAFQRRPAYTVVVADRRHASLFHVDGGSIEQVNHLEGTVVRDRSFAGWHGLQEYRTRNRADEVARHHFHDTAHALERRLCRHPHEPFVVGGHEVGVTEFVGSLPAKLRDRMVGTFTLDPSTLTPQHVLSRSAPVVARWEAAREQRVADEIAGMAESEASRTVIHGLDRCADAVTKSLVQTLVVRGEEPAQGYACDPCGYVVPAQTDPGSDPVSDRALGQASCPGCGAPTRPLVDVLNELTARVLEERGQVELVGLADAADRTPAESQVPTDTRVWARLRSPLPAS